MLYQDDRENIRLIRLRQSN